MKYGQKALLGLVENNEIVEIYEMDADELQRFLIDWGYDPDKKDKPCILVDMLTDDFFVVAKRIGDRITVRDAEYFFFEDETYYSEL